MKSIVIFLALVLIAFVCFIKVGVKEEDSSENAFRICTRHFVSGDETCGSFLGSKNAVVQCDYLGWQKQSPLSISYVDYKGKIALFCNKPVVEI